MMRPPRLLLHYQGEAWTFPEAAARTGQRLSVLYVRRHRGWSDAEIIEGYARRGKARRPPGRFAARRQKGDTLAAAIARYLLAHPEEARYLAAKYGWKDG